MSALGVPKQLTQFASRAWSSAHTGSLDAVRPDSAYRGLRLGVPDRAIPGLVIDTLRPGTPTQPLTARDWPLLKSYLAEPRPTPPRTPKEQWLPAPLNKPGPGSRDNLVFVARVNNASGFDQIDEARIAAMSAIVTGNRYALRDGSVGRLNGETPRPARPLRYAQAASLALPRQALAAEPPKPLRGQYGDYRDLIGQLMQKIDAARNPTIGDPSHTKLKISEWVEAQQTQIHWSITLDAELTAQLRTYLIPAAVEAIHAAQTLRPQK
ncbi:MAG TPA: hypothetical protein PLQ67_03130 [Burkholderiaceae bacterium]|nr:hypothetical protein [Burkholderiaceae bacterium]